MKFVTDLHLHSKYSRAVSQQMTLPNMAHWGKLKGIDVMATGDFTHPFWLDHLRSELEDEGNGLFRLKSVNRKSSPRSDLSDASRSDLDSNNREPFFMLSCEVSSIYSQGGKGRRIHTLFMFPSFGAVEKFNKELMRRRANLRSDGRPIVGISSRDLAAIALECSEKALIIPAHVWTPWFSVFGSFSGFDSVEECFGDMAKYIYGVETGLSSDPAMNWQIENLDKRSILSFSDAHSLEKMGREATVVEAREISYESIYQAIKSSVVGSQLSDSSQSVNQSSGLETDKQKTDEQDTENRKPKTDNRIAFTIEFYPEEGKYHFTGHKNCNYSQGPEKDRNAPCPVCGRSLTVGVMDRVEELKTRNSKFEIRNSNGVRWVQHDDVGRPPFVSMVPLMEIIAEAVGVGVGTQKVKDNYLSLVSTIGSELSVLIKASVQDIARFSSGRIAEGVAKVRSGDITVTPGYDNTYGIVRIWEEVKSADETAVEEAKSQLNLFS